MAVPFVYSVNLQNIMLQTIINFIKIIKNKSIVLKIKNTPFEKNLS